MSSRFTTITATNASVDNLTTGIIKAQSTTGIEVISDINLNSKNINGVNKVAFANYELLEDYINKTIAIRVSGTRLKGALYDNLLNKPFEQIIPLTKTYIIPADNIVLSNDIIADPYNIYVIEPTENTVFELPALSSTSIFQNTHVRFTNQSAFLVSFTYNAEPIIQMGYETISLVWRSTNGTDYSWVYVP